MNDAETRTRSAQPRPSDPRTRCALALAATLVLVVVPAAGRGACTDAADLTQFEKALRRTLACASRRLRSGEHRFCKNQPPPPCGREEIAEIAGLLQTNSGGVRPGSPQARCQAATFRAAHRYVRWRTRERRLNLRRQRRSLHAMRLRDHCDVQTVGAPPGLLPSWGGSCAHLTSEAGQPIGGSEVTRCLRVALEGIVNSVLGQPALQPNVVLIVTDDQHPAANDVLPSVSQLARQGVRFTNAFATTPICAPSRASILTGQLPETHGTTQNVELDGNGNVKLLDDSSTLATWFGDAGYQTALVGKYLNGYELAPPHVPKGWDEWRVFVNDTNNFFDYSLNENGTVVDYGSEPGDYSTDVLARHALDFVTANAASPFFLMLAPFAPHSPSTPAPRHLGALSGRPPWRPPSWGETDFLDKPAWLRFFSTRPDQLAAFDAEIAMQLESLLSVDEAIDALMTRLDELGVRDNTIVLFTADHGIQWGEHRWTTKQVAYEESIRIPMVISYPLGLPDAAELPDLVLNIDVAPTLTALSGVVADIEADGRSFADLAGEAIEWRSDFAIRHFEGGFTVPPWDAIRTTTHKYVRHHDDSDELYDLMADPYELDNKATDPGHTNILESLSTLLDRRLAG